jgi:hypothetical protein
MRDRNMVGQRRAARELGVGEPTFKAWVEAGMVPAHRDPFTGRVRYSLPALREWLKTAGNDNLNPR